MVNIEANSIQLGLGHIIKNPERENDIETASISYKYLDHNSIFKKRSSNFFTDRNIQVKVFKTLTFIVINFKLSQGDNGKLELSIIGFSDTFEVSPSIINQEGQFVISVKNNKRLDYELLRQLNFKVIIINSNNLIT